MLTFSYSYLRDMTIFVLKIPEFGVQIPEWQAVVVVVVVAFSARAILLGECSTVHSPPALFFFFKVEINLHKLIPLFRPGSVHSGSASRDDCDRVFPYELRVSSISDRNRTYHNSYVCSKIIVHQMKREVGDGVCRKDSINMSNKMHQN